MIFGGYRILSVSGNLDEALLYKEFVVDAEAVDFADRPRVIVPNLEAFGEGDRNGGRVVGHDGDIELAMGGLLGVSGAADAPLCE